MCLAEDLRQRGKLDLTEGVIDASFTAAKKGALLSVQRSVAKGRRYAVLPYGGLHEVVELPDVGADDEEPDFRAVVTNRLT